MHTSDRAAMTDRLLLEMAAYYAGQPGRIQHYCKVYEFSRLLGAQEKLDADTQFVLETAAVVHDIGIKPSEEKYGDGSGPNQEKEGPPVAGAMLRRLGYDEAVIARVCYLVGHHHTYTQIDGPDYQILVEADFLVNLYENGTPREGCRSALEKIFRTQSGRALCRTMFAL